MIKEQMLADIGGRPSPWPVLDLVPHDHPMSLLSEVLSVSNRGLVAAVDIDAHSPFCEAEGVPALVAIEYMAQAIAAFAGHQALSAGDVVSLGFLVGSRRFNTNVAFLPAGCRLWVCVKPVLQGDNGLSVFECHLSADAIEISANLNVYQPADPTAFLREDDPAQTQQRTMDKS